MVNGTSESGYSKRPLWQWILLYLVIGSAAYGLIYYFVLARNGGGYANNSTASSYTTPVPSGDQSQSPSAQMAPMTATVTYTDNGFSPTTVTIAKGGTVTFKNTASDDVRVASNPHPIHNGYPTTGGCVGSTFDSCQNIPPSGSWAFTFTYVGSWGYHNHLNPNEGGKVVVQ